MKNMLVFIAAGMLAAVSVQAQEPETFNFHVQARMPLEARTLKGRAVLGGGRDRPHAAARRRQPDRRALDRPRLPRQGRARAAGGRSCVRQSEHFDRRSGRRRLVFARPGQASRVENADSDRHGHHEQAGRRENGGGVEASRRVRLGRHHGRRRGERGRGDAGGSGGRQARRRNDGARGERRRRGVQALRRRRAAAQEEALASRTMEGVRVEGRRNDDDDRGGRDRQRVADHGRARRNGPHRICRCWC